MVRGVPSMVSGIGKGETTPDRIKGLRTRAALAEAEVERLQKGARRERQGGVLLRLDDERRRTREIYERRADRKQDRQSGGMMR